MSEIQAVERSTSLLGKVPNAAGKSYLDEEGWPEHEVDPARRRLDRIDRRLAAWQDRWMNRIADILDEFDSDDGLQPAKLTLDL